MKSRSSRIVGAADGLSRTRTLLCPERDGGGHWTFWLDRPGTSQNSLGRSELRELDSLLGRVEADRDATRLLLRGHATKGFCSGPISRNCGTIPRRMRSKPSRGSADGSSSV